MNKIIESVFVAILCAVVIGIIALFFLELILWIMFGQLANPFMLKEIIQRGIIGLMVLGFIIAFVNELIVII